VLARPEALSSTFPDVAGTNSSRLDAPIRTNRLPLTLHDLQNLPTFGAHTTEKGVAYRTWAPDRDSIEVDIVSHRTGDKRTVSMRKNTTGFHTAIDPSGRVGDRYAFRIDGAGPFPDPASRFQPEGVHAPSEVVSSRDFRWTDEGWARPSFRDLVIYELHVGTFTDEGTFRGAISKLTDLRELGVTAIEIMPVADFPGGRNWGYDGVLIYAPSRAYGTPDDLRAFVDAAHSQGLAVILDVVYNHLGPDGNYLPALSAHFFHEKRQTPWGSAFNCDGPDAAPVRRFFIENPIYWMEEFHIDGFRLDATHEIIDASRPHLLAEITDAIHSRGGYAIAEDPRNERAMLLPTGQGGYGFDAVWADDFHHVVRVRQTGERESYYQEFEGTEDELLETLQHGWFYRGQKLASAGKLRGTPCEDLPPPGFVHCISNHDQTGNRALGDRLHHTVSLPEYRAASVLLCLTPYTPMLFMGQEWAASTPFAFFTEHNEELGRLVTAGRRQEFAAFKAFSDPAARARIPDPQADATFLASKLQWKERADETHAAVLRLYRSCLSLRRNARGFRPTERAWETQKLKSGAGAMRIKHSDAEYLVVFELLRGQSSTPVRDSLPELPTGQRWSLLLSSEEPRFGGHGSGFDKAAQECSFTTAETLVLTNSPAVAGG